LIINLDDPNELLSQIRTDIVQLKSLEHPNLLQYRKTFKCERTLWLAMEYIDGAVLSDLSGICKLSETQIACISQEVLQALLYLHHSNIIHVNLNANNVFVSLSGDVKIGELSSFFWALG
jgi:serine/threonine protein kinase